MVGDLARALVGLLPADRASTAEASIEPALETGLAEARRRWPDAPSPDAAFVAYVVERAGGQPDLASALPRLRIGDLALAWWVGSNEPRAITAFEAAHAATLARLLRRFHRLDADELRQRLRIKLLVGDESTPPRIRDYSGFGYLENWFKIVAARTFLDIASAQRSDAVELDDTVLAGVAATGKDPLDAVARAQLVAATKTALAAAIAELPSRERTFLRHAMLDHLTLDQIAATYQLHRGTVARTLASARRLVHAGARTALIAELGVGENDTLASMLPLIDSQIELSLHRLFPDQTL
ncbi:MAG TPA: sigma-70 family RNA polymerase sigma factor [Kofleriaceae bacterium]|jgi:RNA polymerase sigma-70 factor